eukprot:SM000046S16362  [mRNA]  locus=s46:176766:185791:- [translate_table: standard]
MLRCPTGPEVVGVHNLLRDALAGLMRDAGYRAIVEVSNVMPITTDSQGGHHRRTLDIVGAHQIQASSQNAAARMKTGSHTLRHYEASIRHDNADVSTGVRVKDQDVIKATGPILLAGYELLRKRPLSLISALKKDASTTHQGRDSVTGQAVGASKRGRLAALTLLFGAQITVTARAAILLIGSHVLQADRAHLKCTVAWRKVVLVILCGEFVSTHTADCTLLEGEGIASRGDVAVLHKRHAAFDDARLLHRVDSDALHVALTKDARLWPLTDLSWLPP